MSCGEEEQEQEPEQGVAAELEWSKSYYHIMISPMSASSPPNLATMNHRGLKQGVLLEHSALQSKIHIA